MISPTGAVLGGAPDSRPTVDALMMDPGAASRAGGAALYGGHSKRISIRLGSRSSRTAAAVVPQVPAYQDPRQACVGNGDDILHIGHHWPGGLANDSNRTTQPPSKLGSRHRRQRSDARANLACSR